MKEKQTCKARELACIIEMHFAAEDGSLSYITEETGQIGSYNEQVSRYNFKPQKALH